MRRVGSNAISARLALYPPVERGTAGLGALGPMFSMSEASWSGGEEVAALALEAPSETAGKQGRGTCQRPRREQASARSSFAAALALTASTARGEA